MNAVIINGDFLCRNLTGIERFAFETCIRLDRLLPNDSSVSILIPQNALSIPDFKHIHIYRSNRSCRVFPLWEHGTFGRFVRKHHALPLDFSNVTPVGTPGIVFIHDIYAKLYPEDFKTVKERLIRRYMCLMYRYAVHHAKKLITVSSFSRKQIADTYHIPQERISVIPNGWDHFKTIEADYSIFESLPHLQQGLYYFTLGSLQKRKNLKWIVHYAASHPQTPFVVSGRIVSGFKSDDIVALHRLANVFLPGTVSDGQVKALMEQCRAFIFPSYYEGFGIPPLEALSCGVPVVAARAASMPELYGNSVHWINPDSTEVNLDTLLNEPVDSPNQILEKYTYDKAAESLFKILGLL